MSKQTDVIENARYSCTLGGAVATARNIYRTIPIMHAGPGCGPQISMGQSSTAGFQGVGYIGGNGIPSTNMYEKEVVFGGEARLRELIDSSLEIMDGDLFFVLTGCTSDIIGDDVESIVNEYRQKGVPIVSAETAGFKGNTFLGYELVFEALINQLVKPSRVEKGVVNLFGIVPYQDINWQGNLEEITRLLRRLGLQVNTFVSNSQGPQTIINSSKAELNIVFSNWLGEGIINLYKEKFGTPHLRIPGLPIGPTATGDFLKLIGQTLHIAPKLVQTVIDEEADYVYHYFERLTEIYLRYRFALIGDSTNLIGYTRFLVNDFGQIPLLTIVTDNPPLENQGQIAAELKKLDYVKPPNVVFSQDQWTIKQEILKIKPTYILGSSLDREAAQELGVPFQSVSFPVTDRLVMNRGYAGYRGSITLIEDLFTPR